MSAAILLKNAHPHIILSASFLSFTYLYVSFEIMTVVFFFVSEAPEVILGCRAEADDCQYSAEKHDPDCHDVCLLCFLFFAYLYVSFVIMATVFSDFVSEAPEVILGCRAEADDCQYSAEKYDPDCHDVCLLCFCRSPFYTQQRRKRLLFFPVFFRFRKTAYEWYVKFTNPLDFTLLKCYNVSIQFTVLKR